ncbi:MAG: methylated-DNA--[protein]-cysteine S-methyltransferase [Pseudomonadota bacterium]
MLRQAARISPYDAFKNTINQLATDLLSFQLSYAGEQAAHASCDKRWQESECRPGDASGQLRHNRHRSLRNTKTMAADTHPLSPHEMHTADDDIAALARYIDNHADDTLTLAHLAARVGLNPTHLQKRFKRVMGVSPKAYQDRVRVNRFKRALRDGDSVTTAIHSAGFGSTSRVYGMPARAAGMTPSAYAKGGQGETIYYACRTTRLGPLMMAATERGVCFAMFGDDEAALADRLAEEFPAARRLPSPNADGVALDNWIEALDAHLSRRGPRPELPLDLRGTAFQTAVWQFLLRTTEGEVLSYGELARGIGKPTATRAAASACGANRVAVLVPCHRVLRGDGTPGGYRWGVERKRELLAAERDAMGRSSTPA